MKNLSRMMGLPQESIAVLLRERRQCSPPMQTRFGSSRYLISRGPVEHICPLRAYANIDLSYKCGLLVVMLLERRYRRYLPTVSRGVSGLTGGVQLRADGSV